MKNNKLEANILIAVNALRKTIEMFAGPFLTTYFIKTSAESILDVSIYNIMCYVILIISFYFIGFIIKSKFRIGSLRVGVITNFIYILSIIILKEKVIDYLWLLSILYGISSALYYLPYNLFTSSKIKNEDRTRYEVVKEIVLSTINIVLPIALGSIITVTNYIQTAVIILVISLIQVILSFFITPIEESKETFRIRNVFSAIKKDKNVRNIMLTEYLIGVCISYSALVTITTILVYNAFSSDLNLGIVTSVAAVLQLVVLHLYGKYYENKDNSKILILSSLVPIFCLGMFLIFKNNATVVIYNLGYTIFVKLIDVIRVVKLYDVSNSSEHIDKTNLCEFWVLREICLNLGRVTGFVLLFIAGLLNTTIALNVVMIVLSLTIFVSGMVLKTVKA